MKNEESEFLLEPKDTFIFHFSLFTFHLLYQSVCALADVYAVLPFELWEGGEVFLCDVAGDVCFVGRVDECHAASFEARSAESSAVDAVGVAHDFVERLEFRRTGLPVRDAALSALEAEAPIGVEVALPPGLGAPFHAVELRVPMLGTASPRLWQTLLVVLIDFSRHGPQVRLGELAVLHAGVGHEGVGCTSRLIDAHVEFAAGQRPLYAAEEHGDAVGLHGGMRGDKLVLVGLGVEVEQMVLLRIHLAALVELAAVDADVVVLCCHGDVYQLERRGLYVVDVAKRLEEDESHGSRRREAADGEAAFDDAAQTARERIQLGELQRSAAQVVGPVVLLVAGHVADVELGAFVELQGAKLHHAVVLGTIGDVDAFVDGQTGNLAQIGIAVRPDGAYAVGAEGKSLRVALIDILESFLALHGVLNV